MNVNYLNDSDLDFLQHCSEEQLANFARLLTHNEKGKTRLSSVLMRNELFKSMGVFFGQYFINTITWFFLTWFPIYLVQEKGMSILKVGLVASIPALCGFAGGVLGGVFSDYLIKRGLSLTLARKLPIVLGMLLASTIILCNYTNNTTLVVMLMALAFFGKGFGALGWPVISDTAPKEIVGLCGGVFNVFGNVASIVTPLVIGYLVSELHSFNAALVFVGCSALMAMVCYLFVVGDIKRMELQK